MLLTKRKNKIFLTYYIIKIIHSIYIYTMKLFYYVIDFMIVVEIEINIFSS